EFPSQMEAEELDKHPACGPEGDKPVKAAFDAPFYIAFNNLDLSMVNDSRLPSLTGIPIGWGCIYELAYDAYEDPKYAWLLRQIEEAHPAREREFPALPMSVQGGMFKAFELDILRLRRTTWPEGSFQWSDECSVSLTGRHTRGCSLLPTTGVAVLRNHPERSDGANLHMHWGPHVAGHQSPSALHIDLHAGGSRLTDAPCSGGYDDPAYLSWVRTTIAHNTVTVDQRPMYPYHKCGDSIWEAERWHGRPSGGVLIGFQPGEEFSAVRAANDN
ncbi:unnamed protein product, partial [marine sediment metagenome]